jgi:Glycosyl hydrolases family 39
MTNLNSSPRNIRITLIVSTLLACFAAQCHSQETVSVNFSEPGKPLVRLNQSISNGQISNGPQDDQLIKNLGMRLERTFWSPAAWAQAGSGKYDFNAANPFGGVAPAPDRDWGSDSPLLDNIIAQGAQPVICFTGGPGWDASADTQTAELDGLPVNMNEYQQLVKDGLNHLRSKYPGIQYIEVWNEPDNDLTPQQYNKLYQNVSEAVQAVNAALPSGARPFLVGGPAVYNPSSSIMGNFISFVRANSLELDFLSWHEYGGNIRSDAQILQNKLSSAGLNPNLPQFVTEWGYTSHDTTSIPDPSQLMVAATYVARGWTELETNDLAGIVTTFPSSEDEYRNYGRSMLVPYSENPLDGQVFPLYNVYQMMSMEKNTLVANSGVSGGTSSLFPLATEDGSGVTLMLTNTAGSNVSVNLNSLPSTFQQGAFQFTEYLVDGTHSNWAYNQSTSALQQVANSTEGATSSFSTTLNMPKNSVILVVLTPNSSGASNPIAATPESAGAGSPLKEDPAFDTNSALLPHASAQSTGGAVSQTVINYPNGFASSSGQIWLENNATLSGSSIHLVPSLVHNASNAWFETVENEQAFTTTFTFHIVCTANPSDCGGGFGFMMICKCTGGNPVYGGSDNLPGYTYSGFSGAQFSWSQCAQPLTPASTYCYNSPDGNNGSSDLKQLPDNIIVTFNNYNNNPPGTPGASLTTYATNGTFPAAPVTAENNMAPSGIDLNSGHEFSATITYNGSTLTESLTDTATNANYTHTYTGVNIPAAITGNTAFIGFGGGTGAAQDDVYLDTWTYTVD